MDSHSFKMFHSPACWRTARDVHREFDKLTSETARKEAVKDQIRIRVKGFRWDLHVPWSKDGKDFTAAELRDKLIKSIIPAQQSMDIPEVPPVNLPSRGIQHGLWTKSLDLESIEEREAEEEEQFRMEAEEKME